VLPFEPDRVAKNAREAPTKDLLDRVTVYREGMEPEALRIIEDELRKRGVNWQEIVDHGQRSSRDAIVDANGIALPCSFCPAPAIAERWGWHWMWGKVPLFPRRLRYCREHDPLQAEAR
jgi:hypothetical protein